VAAQPPTRGAVEQRSCLKQEGKRFFDKSDMADHKLFAHVTPDIWKKRTFLIMYHLLDNYERDTSECEVEAAIEKQETADFLADFLAACMATQPMRYCFRYLVAKVRLRT